MGSSYSVSSRSSPRLAGGRGTVACGELVIFAPARVLGLPCPSVDDATPSLSIYTTVSDCRYKSEALGIDPL